ncbi:EAL domain-containing protein [Caenispirillum salinarum]|uniref:EAL domain-containing response regulator n=1 Tax=Caenispirillum salinarum TaxID=859058 RepID=UPI00384FEBBF
MTDQPLLVIIDDEPDMIDVMAEIGDRLGYDVLSHLNARDFWDAPPRDGTVVILDLSMPDMDGIDFIRELSKSGPEVRLVLSSGHGERMLDAARRIATERGLTVIGTLPKPFGFEDLKRILQATRPAARPCGNGCRWAPELKDLRRALAEGEIVPYFQPQVNLRTLRLTGAEALVRWPHPDHGMVTPDRLVPLVLEAGLESDLILALIRQSLETVDVLSRHGIGCRMSVNASAPALRSFALADEILSLLRDRHDPSVLTLEVTETGAVGHLAEALDVLSRLRLRGVHLAIDDFGTGYSSLQQLAALPFNELKIDRSFIAGVDESGSRRRMLDGMADLGRRLDMTVVAEGVERDEEWLAVREAGCDMVQGYLIARPMPAADFVDWCRTWNRTRTLHPRSGATA